VESVQKHGRNVLVVVTTAADLSCSDAFINQIELHFLFRLTILESNSFFYKQHVCPSKAETDSSRKAEGT
jgi:hypothetical protein